MNIAVEEEYVLITSDKQLVIEQIGKAIKISKTEKSCCITKTSLV